MPRRNSPGDLGDTSPERAPRRRYLVLTVLRALNITALVLAFWPLVLAAFWLDTRGADNDILVSGLIAAGLAAYTLISMLPLSYRQSRLRRQSLPDNSTGFREDRAADLSELEIIRPASGQESRPPADEEPGRHSSRALGTEDEYLKLRRVRRSSIIDRFISAIGVNSLRLLLTAGGFLLFNWIGSRFGLMTSMAAALSAVLLSAYGFTVPLRSYGDIFTMTHYTVHIAGVVILQGIRTFFDFPLQADFHLLLLFVLTLILFLTRNQTNIDSLMRQGSRSLKELPHGLRAYNARLTSLLVLSFPLIYILRRPIAAVLSFIWRIITAITVAILRFLERLLPSPAPIEPVPQPTGEAPEPQPPVSGSGYWIQTILTALIITFLVYLIRRYHKEIAGFFRDLFRRLRALLARIFNKEFEETDDVEEGRFYTDYHRELDPGRGRRRPARRSAQWKKAYQQYRRRYGSRPASGDLLERYREAYRLALSWMDIQEEAGLDVTDTVREIADGQKDRLAERNIASPEYFESVTSAYEDVRYGEDEGVERGPGLGSALQELEEELRRMSRGF